MSYFSDIPEPRVSALLDILFLSISAVLRGSEGWEEIEDFGRAKQAWLKKYFPFDNSIPKHDTIARVLSRLVPTALQNSFIGWMTAACELSHGEVVAIDGKTFFPQQR